MHFKTRVLLSDVLMNYGYVFELHDKELIADCNLYPTEIDKSITEWLYTSNNKYNSESIDERRVGKWMLFLSKDRVNAIWDKIKMSVVNGDLWISKVSTTDAKEINYAIMIYTKDYTDLDDVIDVLNHLESSGIKSPNITIKYKTDEQTRAGIYSGGRQKPWIYSSDTIREYRESVGAHTLNKDAQLNDTSWKNKQGMVREFGASPHNGYLSWRNKQGMSQDAKATQQSGNFSWRNKQGTSQDARATQQSSNFSWRNLPPNQHSDCLASRNKQSINRVVAGIPEYTQHNDNYSNRNMQPTNKKT